MTSDLNGTVSQYIEYIPFGEEMYSAHRNTYNSPYRYNAKELDEETGLYYYGARYYNPKLSIWLSVDPMVEKYISLSSYNYVMNNPIKYIDPDGRDIILIGNDNSSITIKTDIIDIKVDGGAIVGDLGGNYILQGDDVLIAALDIVGIVDPTGVADFTAASLEAEQGNWGSAFLSGLGVIPLIGDVAKVGKVGKHVKTINKAIDGAKTQREQLTKVFSSRKKALDSRPKPATAKPGQKQVTRQTRNKSGEGKKFKTDRNSQTSHIHDKNHTIKKKPNIHYRVGTKKIKP